ncbi:penicillin acylase family protein [Glaciecola sp. MH2013]|uniref:penicillin acylase family protein n=1 Tax=Glaciecola sp. MH2013 TaxID=2785524 RepID=UPI00189F50F7|nr:penicillin acylase family protein [Glaciecola sp. MH2013]MBF7072966.1 penicillin acylase family protein [Glaciecola sp. MH2013]
MKFIKPSLSVLAVLLLILLLSVIIVLKASLPQLDSTIQSHVVSADTILERDDIGTAIITAHNRADASFALGYAHGQDRLFQIDLLRRSAAGELSEILGTAALGIDKRSRFHQFRKRAESVFMQLPKAQQSVLLAYSAGVNKALSEYTVKPFEYLLTNSAFAKWKPEDSLLVSYSMYLDLQGGQVERDLVNTIIKQHFGNTMLQFFNLASPYQAALDGSIMSSPSISIPEMNPYILSRNEEQPRDYDAHNPKSLAFSTQQYGYDSIEELNEMGSNNWAVTGKLTESGHAMMSDDMHLGLRVPPIWYRAQLNYEHQGKPITITGVSLPGTPLIIAGSNGNLAWGFTNANLDNADWIALDDLSKTERVVEVIKTKEGHKDLYIEISEHGPVRTLMGKKYALAWVAHQPYAVNMTMTDMAHAASLEEAFSIADSVRIPVQNLILADSKGNAGWRPIGAVSARDNPSLAAIPEQHYSSKWRYAETQLPSHVNPDEGRLWTANARVMATSDMKRFGDGGYALGVRGLQIRDRMFEKTSFDEQAFYDIQLDNEARFLQPWHSLLLKTLRAQPNAEDYQQDIQALENWGGCACGDSIGYTLARKYRSAVINSLLAPIDRKVREYNYSLRNALRKIEPAVWLLLDNQVFSWLPSGELSYDSFLINTYDKLRRDLVEDYSANSLTLVGLEWGEVNKLAVQHPFSAKLGPLGSLLNMPEVKGFGDSYMPAVQSTSFGASQRFIAQPGMEENAILTLPGGQSGHPLSDFYKKGFEEYATHQPQALLPGKAIHKLVIQKQEVASNSPK